MMVEHRYGGNWTEVKTKLLKSYMTFYTTALSRNKYFNLIYIDAFAGTGERVVDIKDSLNLGDNNNVIYDGSAKVALSMNPPFKKLYFIESDKDKIKDLNKLKRNNPTQNVTIYHGDANQHVIDICKKENWNKNRGLLFLDPYGMEVEFGTLKVVSRTRKIDVCYLFPLSGISRQASRDLSRIENYKEAALNKVLGTDDWKKLYRPKRQLSLFSNDQTFKRNSGAEVFDDMIRSRLEEIFPYVSSPVKLPKKGAPLFSFYYAVSNPSYKAINLAKKAIESITRQPF